MRRRNLRLAVAETLRSAMVEFVIVFVCILFNAVLSGAEMAFVTVRKSQLREASKNGSARADYLLKMRENPERTLSIVQIGITMVGAIAAAVGGAGAEELLSPYLGSHLGLSENAAEALSIAIIVVPITYLSVVFGELIPKTLAIRNAYNVAILSSYMFAFLDRVLSPIVTLLEWSTRKIIGVIFRKKKGEEVPAPEVETNIELDSLPSLQRQYVLNVVDLGKKTLQSIYTPWSDMNCLKTSMTFEKVEETLVESSHTRFPVFQENNLTGVLNSREFLELKAADRKDWLSLVRPRIALQAKTPLLNALRMMQEKKNSIAIVLSEHRQIGMVAMKDIFEEVVGEIYDEDDESGLKRILSSGPKRKWSAV